MIRARSAFEVCKNSEPALHAEELEEGMDTRQIYAEDQVSLMDTSCSVPGFSMNVQRCVNLGGVDLWSMARACLILSLTKAAQ